MKKEQEVRKIMNDKMESRMKKKLNGKGVMRLNKDKGLDKMKVVKLSSRVKLWVNRHPQMRVPGKCIDSILPDTRKC